MEVNTSLDYHGSLNMMDTYHASLDEIVHCGILILIHYSFHEVVKACGLHHLNFIKFKFHSKKRESRCIISLSVNGFQNNHVSFQFVGLKKLCLRI